MRVAVDQTGNRGHAARLDLLGRTVRRGNLRIGADGDDSIVADGNGGVLHHPALRVHGDGGDVTDQEVVHAGVSIRR